MDDDRGFLTPQETAGLLAAMTVGWCAVCAVGVGVWWAVWG